jgi:16S rRNA (cytosine967-C5)-methyltransferase
VLPEENEDQVAAFVAGNATFAPLALPRVAPAYERVVGLQMTPLQTGCDGFYVALLEKCA